MAEALTVAELRRLFYYLYQDSPRPLRLLSAARPYVCPYDRLARFVPQGATVLDVGCGAGSLLAMLATQRRIVRGVGCDPSSAALNAARMAARRSGGEAILSFLRIGDASHMPLGPFDVVAMVDVLHHVPPPERHDVVAEAARRVGPGGAFIYKDMTTRSRLRRLAHNLDDWVFTREWVEQVAEGAAEAWAEEEGLETLHAEYIPRLIYGHELRVFRRRTKPASEG